jgi:outer membrane immunogenic protein
MKKFGLALAIVAAFTGSAVAADMGPRAYSKAPAPMMAAPSWTGCYVAGGGGYGMYSADTSQVNAVTGAFINAQGTTGGRGWIGQAQAGCDYQFAGPLGNWVIGAFGDYNFQNVRADHLGAPGTITVGTLKQDSAWAVGGRIGYLVTPSFLSYFSGGYTQTHFDQIDYNRFSTLLPFGSSLPGATYTGYFLGSGFEYALGLLPGLYLKSEYRFSEFQGKRIVQIDTATGSPLGFAESVKPFSQSVTTSLVYRFNWGGTPISTKY